MICLTKKLCELRYLDHFLVTDWKNEFYEFMFVCMGDHSELLLKVGKLYQSLKKCIDDLCGGIWVILFLVGPLDEKMNKVIFRGHDFLKIVIKHMTLDGEIFFHHILDLSWLEILGKHVFESIEKSFSFDLLVINILFFRTDLDISIF